MFQILLVVWPLLVDPHDERFEVPDSRFVGRTSLRCASPFTDQPNIPAAEAPLVPSAAEDAVEVASCGTSLKMSRRLQLRFTRLNSVVDSQEVKGERHVE